jgi:thiamine biosynthesis lipoprotein ApbE
MKKIATFAAIVILCAAGCQQNTEREVSQTATTETTTISTATVDTAAATDAARDAAHATGTAMETAGQEIQDQTKTDTK